jgi:hypothetical protein
MGGKMRSVKCGFIASLICLIPFLVQAQVAKMEMDALTKESTSIVHGICTGKSSFWNESRDKIFTRVTLQVSEVVKGEQVKETTILIPGGRVDNIIYEVSDMPLIQKDEEMVLFLWQHKSGMNLVTGGLQGKVTIKSDTRSGKKFLKGEAMGHDHAAEQTGNAELTEIKHKDAKIYLDEYLDEIRKHVKD